jgi:protoporphyrinogen/coproporphyrinogen III oxidase
MCCRGAACCAPTWQQALAVIPNAQVLVVGAGISGLTCAYALRKAGIDAQILEASSSPGGIIRSERRDGFLLELGPQSFSATAPVQELCKELDLEDQIVEAPPRAPRFVVINGALRQVPLSPPAFLASSLVSAKTKWTILRDAIGRSTPPASDESIADFVRRKFSPELLDRLVGPFVSGIYAGDPERLSVRAAFPQLYEAEKAAGSIIRGMIRAARASKGPRQRPTLQSFCNGNATMLQALAAKLGDALRLNAEVKEIRKNAPINTEKGSSYSVVVNLNSDEETIQAQHVVLATPTNVVGKLLQNVDPAFEPLLAVVEYAPVAVVSLGYQTADIGHDLNGFGFLIPRSAGLRTLGTVWNSSLFPGRAPAGHALLTSFVGGATDPQAVSLPSEELASLVHREIAPILAIRRAPVFSNVEFYQRALPQYNLGHAERLAALSGLREKHSNLWLAGNYLRGPAIGACVEQALYVAEEVVKRIQK